MSTTATLRTILFSVFALFQNILPSQGQVASQKGQNESIAPKIVELVETRLEQPGDDTAKYFILDLVQNHCKGDYGCLLRTYDVVLKKLEGEFHFYAGLLVAKEMAKLAEQQGDVDAQASAIGRISGIYGFMSNQEMMILYKEQMRALYERAGNIEKALQTKFSIIESRVWYLGEAADALPELEQTLEEALEKDLTDLANRFRIRIKYVCEEHGYDDKFVEQVEALEKITYSNPLQSSETHPAFHAASGRGDILLKKKKYDQAKEHYLKALDIFESRENSHHDVWLQVYALFRLAKLEWERRDATEAKKYLREAYDIAARTKMYDRLIIYLDLMTEIAVAEKNYEDAYRYTEERIVFQAKLESIKSGFDEEKYHIQLQREQLETEKKRQALELKLSRDRLKATIAIVALVALLAVGFLFGFYKQKQSKKQIAAQLHLIQQQAKQLKNLDAAKSRFFANISHELRTPLTLMLGPIKSLLKGNHTPQKQEQLLNMAMQSGQQLRQLVNEILDLRKLEMGKMELNLQPTGLRSFFNRYASQFESLAASSNIDFSFETNLENDITALLDREKYRQVMHNLLSNAFKFTPAGGQVKMILEIEKSENPGIEKPPAAGDECTNLPTYQFQLTVSDTGAGIHPDDLPHLFDRFYQTSRPDARAQGGTGIGLALCHEYVQLFGGKIEVESRVGKGSTFRVTFPVTLTESTAETEAISLENVPVIASRAKPESAISAKSAGDARPTILVVEDNPELQTYIRFVLADKYNVITAGNGKEALAVLQDFSPQSAVHDPSGEQEAARPRIVDLILSDLMMPVMDGYQLLEKLKGDETTRHIPVIMLTARAEAQDKLKALRIGVDDYLTKPFDEEELLVRIENLLTNQAMRKEAVTEEPPGADAPDMSQPDQEWLEKFEGYIQKNLSNDALTISFLAQEFAMSESTLFRQVTRLTGLSTKQYLQEVRLDFARQLLDNRVYLTVARVAAEAGFSNARTFTRNFKERFGKSPVEYLNN